FRGRQAKGKQFDPKAARAAKLRRGIETTSASGEKRESEAIRIIPLQGDIIVTKVTAKSVGKEEYIADVDSPRQDNGNDAKYKNDKESLLFAGAGYTVIGLQHGPGEQDLGLEIPNLQSKVVKRPRIDLVGRIGISPFEIRMHLSDKTNEQRDQRHDFDDNMCQGCKALDQVLE
ncbi:hypothetical protein RFI_36955, partial [Reticulomyxa filosa]